MKKTLPILILAIILLANTTAFQITQWQEGGTCQNISLNLTENLSISAPIHSRVTTARINMTPFFSNLSSNGSQPFGNIVSTYRGEFNGSCDALTNPENANNGVWIDSALCVGNIANAWFNINFTIPSTITDMNYTLSYAPVHNGNTEIYCENKTTGTNIYVGDTWNASGDMPMVASWNIPDDCYIEVSLFKLHLKIFNYVGGSAWYFNDMIIVFNNNTVVNTSVHLDNRFINYTTNISNASHVINLDKNFLNAYFENYSTLPINFYSSLPGHLYVCVENITYNNTLNISLKNEDSLQTILENITIEIIQGNSTTLHYTMNGSYFQSNTFDGDIIIAAYNTNYSKRRYAHTFTSGESLQITIYMANRSSETTFTTINMITGDIIEGALVRQYRNLGTKYVLVNSLFTDINGQVVLPYVEDVRYYFEITKTGYENKTFYLDPINSEEYTITMSPTGQQGADNDYYGIILRLSTDVFINNAVNNITIGIISPISILDNYNITIEYPTGNILRQGSQAAGETWDLTFPIVNAGETQRVNITWTYASTLGTRTYRRSYLIEDAGATTMLGLKRSGYGLGILERIIIAILLSLLVGAAIGSLTNGETGFAITLIMMAVVGYILAINILFLIPSLLLGLILLARRNT